VTKPTKQEIESAIAAGMNIREQMHHFGVTVTTLTALRKQYGITATAERKYKRKIDTADIDRLLESPEHPPMWAIARMNGTNWTFVQKRWAKLHPGERYPSRTNRTRNHNRTTPVNLLDALNYNYSAELEKDFHRLHEAKFRHLPWEVFRGQISELCARGINPLGEGGLGCDY